MGHIRRQLRQIRAFPSAAARRIGARIFGRRILHPKAAGRWRRKTFRQRPRDRPIQHLRHRSQRLGILYHIRNIVARRPIPRLRHRHDFDPTFQFFQFFGYPQRGLHARLLRPRQVRHIVCRQPVIPALFRQLFPLPVAVGPNHDFPPRQRRPIRRFPAVAAAQPRNHRPILQIPIILRGHAAFFALDHHHGRIGLRGQIIQPEQRRRRGGAAVCPRLHAVVRLRPDKRQITLTALLIDKPLHHAQRPPLGIAVYRPQAFRLAALGILVAPCARQRLQPCLVKRQDGRPIAPLPARIRRAVPLLLLHGGKVPDPQPFGHGLQRLSLIAVCKTVGIQRNQIAAGIAGGKIRPLPRMRIDHERAEVLISACGIEGVKLMPLITPGRQPFRQQIVGSGKGCGSHIFKIQFVHIQTAFLQNSGIKKACPPLNKVGRWKIPMPENIGRRS